MLISNTVPHSPMPLTTRTHCAVSINTPFNLRSGVITCTHSVACHFSLPVLYLSHNVPWAFHAVIEQVRTRCTSLCPSSAQTFQRHDVTSLAETMLPGATALWHNMLTQGQGRYKSMLACLMLYHFHCLLQFTALRTPKDICKFQHGVSSPLLRHFDSFDHHEHAGYFGTRW